MYLIKVMMMMLFYYCDMRLFIYLFISNKHMHWIHVIAKDNTILQPRRTDLFIYNIIIVMGLIFHRPSY